MTGDFLTFFGDFEEAIKEIEYKIEEKELESIKKQYKEFGEFFYNGTLYCYEGYDNETRNEFLEYAKKIKKTDTIIKDYLEYKKENLLKFKLSMNTN